MPNTDFTINVTYDSSDGSFEYKDERNPPHCAETKRKCHTGKTIQWHLVSGGSSMMIEFPANKDGNPFNSPDGKLLADTSYTFNNSHKSKYNYTVHIFDASGREATDDPRIIFDDGTGISLGTGGVTFNLGLLAGAIALGIFAVKGLLSHRDS